MLCSGCVCVCVCRAQLFGCFRIICLLPPALHLFLLWFFFGCVLFVVCEKKSRSKQKRIAVREHQIAGVMVTSLSVKKKSIGFGKGGSSVGPGGKGHQVVLKNKKLHVILHVRISLSLYLSVTIPAHTLSSK